ncbi:MAG: ABC transporter ATP-binding protein [Zhaonellaceae bacterium]|jgi:putative ABC transport system ATP-binding protein|nr:ABC transporter ATP-binding protein [Clostridia bacterium]
MIGSIETCDLKHTFKLGKIDVPVLHGINLQVKSGEFVALCGASGSGKSTLLNLIAGLTKPTGGKIIINDTDITNLSENQLCLFRQKNLGFIFQSYNLIPSLTALENVELTLIFAGLPPRERKEKAQFFLELVGLADRMNHKPNELSGGQQQRVSVARALVNNPSVVLADEPTGNLDSHTGREIMNLMRKINIEGKRTFLVVTHDLSLARLADRVIFLRDGLVVEEEVVA